MPTTLGKASLIFDSGQEVEIRGFRVGAPHGESGLDITVSVDSPDLSALMADLWCLALNQSANNAVIARGVMQNFVSDDAT